MERYLAAVLVLGVSAQWLAWRLRLPSILLLLLFGVALGEYQRQEQRQDLERRRAEWVEAGRPPSEAPQIEEAIPSHLLFPLVALSVGVILFEGGLSLQLRELRESGAAVLGLVTAGALLTWLLTGCALVWLMDIEPRVAAVIGGILIVTGPTVVGPLLRQVQPSRRVAATAKWEGIVIDPIGAVLAVLAFNALQTNGDDVWAVALAAIGRTVLVGVAASVVGALALVLLLRRYLIPDFLHSPVFLAVCILVFTASNMLQPESGLLSVTLMGIALANQRTVALKHVIEFKENLQVLLIACLFIVLGARVDPRDVLGLGWPAAALLLLMIGVVRPLAVALSTWGTSLNWRERTFLAVLAPRGIVAAAVASVFTLEASHLELSPEVGESLQMMAPLVFLCIATTVAFYGLLAPLAARLLGLSDAAPQGLLLAGGDPWVRQLALTLKNAGKRVVLVDTNYSHVAQARMDGLEAHCGSILAEYIHEDIDLSGIGRLLALTSNDEVNTLACREFSHHFGRKNIYQLAPRGPDAGHRRQQIAEHLRGRLLFSEELDFNEIARRCEQGAQIKLTQITETFPHKAFQEKYGGHGRMLMTISEAGVIEIDTVVHGLKPPQAGQTAVFLYDPSSEFPEQQESESDGGAESGG